MADLLGFFFPPTKPSVVSLANGVGGTKYPVSGFSLGENALLM